MKNHFQKDRNAFTLIEILVVIAIIGILAAILFPVFARARENARKAACLSNEKQIGMALMMYTQDYNETFPLYQFFPPVGGYVWSTALSPYIKATQIFICPDASTITNSCGPTVVNNSHSGSYGYNFQYMGTYSSWGPYVASLTSLASTEYPADTVAISEITQMVDASALYQPVYWGSGSTALCGSATTLGDQFATRHGDGANVVFMDGHVKWLTKAALRDYNRNGKPDDGYFCLTKTIGSSSCPGS